VLFRDVIKTPLGAMLLEADDEAVLRFDWGVPAGTEIRPNAVTAAAGEALARYFGGEVTALAAVPVKPQVTAFRHRVLGAMRRIAPGQVITYGELGEWAGAKAGSFRAIGGACGTNPIPIIIPCHRVVAAGGRMGGFSSPGGLETKRWLLAHEGWNGFAEPAQGGLPL
jgi:methylated-DNA-[protein]-cysteine S-methyltransferase